MARKQRFWFLFVLGWVFCFLLALQTGQFRVKAVEVGNLTPAPSIAIDQSQAETLYRAGRYQEAIALWLKALPTAAEPATIHTNLGSAYKLLGQVGEAIRHWEQAIEIYRTKTDERSSRQLAAVLTDTAQAYNALGQYQRAIDLAKEALSLSQRLGEKKTAAVAQGVLGNAYFIGGDLNRAITAYQASLEGATSVNDPAATATALTNSGNAWHARSQRYLAQARMAAKEGDNSEATRLNALAQADNLAARSAYDRALQVTRSLGGLPEAMAIVDWVRFQQQRTPQPDLADYIPRARSILDKLPDSRSKASALIKLADVAPLPGKISALERAIAVARNLDDRRTESLALGKLAEVYESQQQYERAIEIARQAIWVAQQVNATDSLYRWQWLSGRIYRATGKEKEATLAYQQAIATLQSIRGDVISASKNLQFDVRQQVEPVYRELIGLLLRDASGDRIEESLQVLSGLKLSELQNFFQDDCLELTPAVANPQTVLSNAQAAAISSVILEDKTYTILQLPDGSLKSYPVEVSSKQLVSLVERFRLLLEDIGSDRYLELSQQLYTLLIRPLEADLAAARPKTLVFIHDGILRNIPMAALHDGRQFLVEKYPIATALGLNLTAGDRPAPPTRPALILGLTEELPAVAAETATVEKIVGGSRFLDKDFTSANFRQRLKQRDYAIVHIATHGKFNPDIDSTFLQAFDSRIQLAEFEDILRLRKPAIELLVLSACQTAVGDDRSTLGLAGVALRTGVKSVLATLWFINDADTVPLIADFYRYWHQGTTKAEALQKAQIKAIADPNGHPAIWSPFILVGDWM